MADEEEKGGPVGGVAQGATIVPAPPSIGPLEMVGDGAPKEETKGDTPAQTSEPLSSGDLKIENHPAIEERKIEMAETKNIHGSDGREDALRHRLTLKALDSLKISRRYNGDIRSYRTFWMEVKISLSTVMSPDGHARCFV